MQRCIGLARLGAGNTAPNPLVGAVLVHNNQIIGEGYHQQYGGAHAEVNCIRSVGAENAHLVQHSTMYVSLEPCAHYGKTPPCADLLIHHKIPVVVIGCRDPFEQVNGKGIEKLISAGIKVITPVLEKECLDLNKRFFLFHQLKRPYVVLKWAQTANLKIAAGNNTRLLISNQLTNRLVHQWRSFESAILVGTNTALSDDPALTTRLWPGNNPVRLVIDSALKLPLHLHLLDGQVKTIVFNTLQHKEEGQVFRYKISIDEGFVTQILAALYQLKILSILVEGGSKTIQSFIDANCWDEARVITNTKMIIPGGIDAPILSKAVNWSTHTLLTDTIQYFKPS